MSGVTIGVGQYIWLRMWNDDAEGDDAIIANGVLDPGADIHFKFEAPQTVTRVAVERITKADVARLVAEKGVQQDLDARPSGW